MSHSTMSLPALYSYAKNVEMIEIFDGLTVPAAIDRATLIDWILHRSYPFEVCYPDATYMKFAIGAWSATHQRTFQKWADALAISYDPLNNYDRTEESTETGLENRSKTHTGRTNDVESASDDVEFYRKGSNNSTNIGSTKDASNRDTTTTNSVSAFDSSGWSNADKSVVGDGNKAGSSSLNGVIGTDSNEESTQTDSVKNRTSDDKSGDNESALNSRSHKLRAFGNIGVTTSQQMLQSELDIAAWNMYEHITDMFLDEFCVLLY